jgi:hypothetical protein
VREPRRKEVSPGAKKRMGARAQTEREAHEGKGSGSQDMVPASVSLSGWMLA